MSLIVSSFLLVNFLNNNKPMIVISVLLLFFIFIYSLVLRKGALFGLLGSLLVVVFSFFVNYFSSQFVFKLLCESTLNLDESICSVSVSPKSELLIKIGIVSTNSGVSYYRSVFAKNGELKVIPDNRYISIPYDSSSQSGEDFLEKIYSEQKKLIEIKKKIMKEEVGRGV